MLSFFMPKHAREAASCHASREAASGRFDGGRFSVYQSMQENCRWQGRYNFKLTENGKNLVK